MEKLILHQIAKSLYKFVSIFNIRPTNCVAMKCDELLIVITRFTMYIKMFS